MDIEKIINIIRNLKEEGVPTMNLGAGQIAGTKEAGDDPPVYSKTRKKKWNYAKGGKNSRKWWIKYLKNQK